MCDCRRIGLARRKLYPFKLVDWQRYPAHRSSLERTGFEAAKIFAKVKLNARRSVRRNPWIFEKWRIVRFLCDRETATTTTTTTSRDIEFAIAWIIFIVARCDWRRIVPPHQIFNRSLQNAKPPNESHYVVLDQYLPSREALGGESCRRKLTWQSHNSHCFYWKPRVELEPREPFALSKLVEGKPFIIPFY